MMQSTETPPYSGSVSDLARSPYRMPLCAVFAYGIGIAGRSGLRSIKTTGSPVTGSFNRFPLSINALSRYVCVFSRTVTVVQSARFLRLTRIVLINRGRIMASNAEMSAALIDTVPIKEPSEAIRPPSSSVSIRANPPTVAAESSRNGAVRNAEPAS